MTICSFIFPFFSSKKDKFGQTDIENLLFKYRYASLHSFGLMFSKSGMILSHSALTSGGRKSSHMCRTPDSNAASSNCSSVTGKPVNIRSATLN